MPARHRSSEKESEICENLGSSLTETWGERLGGTIAQTAATQQAGTFPWSCTGQLASSSMPMQWWC